MSVAVETRPERLLPEKASSRVLAARGICPLCGLSGVECEARLNREEARLDLLLGFFGLRGAVPAQ